MKNLYESLLDDFDKISDNIDIIGEIKKFLVDNYSGCYGCVINDPGADGLYIVNCTDYLQVRVGIDQDLKYLTNGLFKFGSVKKFSCSRCSNLISLEGAPEKVYGDFYCVGCNKLTSLEGAPKEVGGDFVCANCSNLTSLKGAPEKVGKNFYCHHCENLKNLKYIPKKINKNFICDDVFTEKEINKVKKNCKSVEYFD
jgi:hypothetical protein